jgi:putative sterol carrier protein
VAPFLSDAWLDDLEVAAASARLAPELRVTIQQVVADASGEVAFAIVVDQGTVAVRRGHHASADVSFRQDRATASAIARGELSAQVAFLDGRLRLGGDISAILERAGALAAIDDLFAEVRAHTTWD